MNTLMSTAHDYVTAFTPSIREDCGDVFWSHPHFKHADKGLGVHYTVTIGDGEPQPYTPGTEIQIASEGQASLVSLRATYEDGFSHQLGQSRVQDDVCVVIPPQPGAEFKWEESEPVEDCDTGEVSVTLTEFSAGYWLNTDTNEWVLGDWFETGNVETKVISEAEGCEVTPPDEPEPETPDEDDQPEDDTPESPAEEETDVVIPKPEVVKEIKTIEKTVETVLTEPTPPATVDAGLAVTGADGLGGAMIGMALVAAGIAAVARRAIRKVHAQ